MPDDTQAQVICDRLLSVLVDLACASDDLRAAERANAFLEEQALLSRSVQQLETVSHALVHLLLRHQHPHLWRTQAREEARMAVQASVRWRVDQIRRA